MGGRDILRAAALAAAAVAALGCDGEIGGGPAGGKDDGTRRGDGPTVRLLDGGAGGGEGGDERLPPAPGDPPAGDAGAGGGGAAYTCEALGYLGACDGEVARWCDGGELKQRDCTAAGQRCRWIDDTTGYYCADGPPAGGDGTVDAGSGGGGGGTVPSGCASDVEARELELTNQARAEAGLSPLTCDEGLARAARLHSEDMCAQGYFSHTSRDGRSFTDRMNAQGVRYGAAGENIAWGQRTAEEVHRAWMGSSGHRANILGRSFRRIGIGHADCGGSPYWTQNFTD